MAAGRCSPDRSRCPAARHRTWRRMRQDGGAPDGGRVPSPGRRAPTVADRTDRVGVGLRLLPGRVDTTGDARRRLRGRRLPYRILRCDRHADRPGLVATPIVRAGPAVVSVGLNGPRAVTFEGTSRPSDDYPRMSRRMPNHPTRRLSAAGSRSTPVLRKNRSGWRERGFFIDSGYGRRWSDVLQIGTAFK